MEFLSSVPKNFSEPFNLALKTRNVSIIRKA